MFTVFHRKSLIQHCERSELRLHFEWTKVNKQCQKWSILVSFWKSEACGQTVLPDRSILLGQKLLENDRWKKFNCDTLSNFQTMCMFWSLIIEFLMEKSLQSNWVQIQFESSLVQNKNEFSFFSFNSFELSLFWSVLLVLLF